MQCVQPVWLELLSGAFGEQLLTWMEQNQIHIEKSLDLACGTGVLCEILHAHGINASGMDFSEGMIAIARERNPKIHYDVADMITLPAGSEVRSCDLYR